MLALLVGDLQIAPQLALLIHSHQHPENNLESIKDDHRICIHSFLANNIFMDTPIRNFHYYFIPTESAVEPTNTLS